MIKYVGKGSYYMGIPARDLSKDEWEAIPRRTQKKVLDLGLYQVETKTPPKRKPRKVLEVTNGNS